jgi:biopolymer transport protein ExbD
MAFFVSKRKLKPNEDAETGELNIVPYLDILMNLTIFMLLSAAGLMSFGVVNATASASKGSGAAAAALAVTVHIEPDGYHLDVSGGPSELGAQATVPTRPDSSYDAAALTERLTAVKASWAEAVRTGLVRAEDTTRVTVASAATIPFDVVVATMDAARTTADRRVLFPDVVLRVGQP